MRKIREVIRLKYYCNRSIREISGSCGIGRGTVGDYLHRAKAAGLSWPLPDDLSDTALEQQLFPSTAVLRNYSYFRKLLTNLHAPAKLQS
jgi:hypothetical protein